MIVNVNPGKNFAGIVGLTKVPLDSVTSYLSTTYWTNSEPFILAAGRNRWEGRTAVLFSVTDEQGVPIESPKLGAVVTISFSVDPSSTHLCDAMTGQIDGHVRHRRVLEDLPPLGPLPGAGSTDLWLV
nr:hypothetical protein BaRGS_026633 [Batillaria attramentaria]